MKNVIILYLLIAGMYLGSILAVLNSENFPVTLFQIILVLSIAVFVWYKIANKNFELITNDYAFVLLIFLAIMFFSIIYSADRTSGFLNAFRFVVLLVFVGFLTNLIVERKQIVKAIVFASLLCLILSVISMGESLFNPEVAIQNLLSQGTKLTRAAAGGIYSDPNRFAASLFIPVAFGFSVMNSRIETKYRVIGGLLFLLIFAGIISSYSRSGFLAVVLICSLNVIFFKRVRPFFLIFLSFIIVILLIPNLRLTMFSYLDRIIDLLTGNIDHSSSIRILLGIAAVKMFLNSYGLGIGYDAFNVHFPKYFSVQESIGVVEPHNITYRILAELGIHGLLIFLVILFFLFRDAYNNIRLAEDVTDRILAVTLFSSFCGYVTFYQFYGGALTDNMVMLNIALILVHKRFLLSKDRTKSLSLDA